MNGLGHGHKFLCKFRLLIGLKREREEWYAHSQKHKNKKGTNSCSDGNI